MIHFIYYPKCSTCIRAKKHLNTLTDTYQERHIVEEKSNVSELKALYEKSGLPLKKFFNTSGMKYRELGLKDKLETMTIEEQLTILASDGMLVKRPILETEDAVLVGFKEADYTKLLQR